MKLNIKKTFLHKQDVCDKYTKLLADGELKAECTLKEVSGMVDLLVDGEPIGRVEDMKPEDIPKVYDLKVVSIGPAPNTFIAEMTAKKAEKAAKEADFKKEIEEAAKASGLSEEDIERRVKCMAENRVHESVIRKVLSGYAKYDIPIANPACLYQDVAPKDTESVMNRALVQVMTGGAVLFIGPKSTGKNVLMETIAYVLGRPYYRVTSNLKALPEDLYGNRSTDNSAAEMLTQQLAESAMRYQKGDASFMEDAARYDYLKAKSSCIRLTFDPSEFVKWAKSGGVINCDELNFWPTDLVQQGLNGAADDEKVINVPNYGQVKLNRNCVLLGGMNPGYAGTVQLNDATASRFSFIELGYPESVKEQLKANFSENSLPGKYFTACNAVFSDFRKMVSQGRVSDKCLNIRGMVRALRAIEAFPEATSLVDQLMTCVVYGCEEDERTILREVVLQKAEIL